MNDKWLAIMFIGIAFSIALGMSICEAARFIATANATPTREESFNNGLEVCMRTASVNQDKCIAELKRFYSGGKDE